MGHGRFEPSAAEQLVELRRSRDRYAALADRLHDGADPDLDPTETQARERDARRIAHAYEKSISNAVVRMASMGQTHHFAMLSLGMRTWMTIFVAISVLEGGILLDHFQPQLFHMPQVMLTKALKMARVADRAPIAAPVVAPRLATPPAAPPPTAALPQSAPAPEPAQIAPAPDAAAPTPAEPVIAPTQTPAPATSAPVTAPSATASATTTPPAPSVPIPSARPTSGPVITDAAPPAPVTQPPPPAPAAATAAQSPSPIVTVPVTQSPLPPVAAANPSPPAPAQAPAAAPVLTRPQAIAGTHTLPPYPNEAKRMGESGSTLMRVAISIQGVATDCTLIASSGSERLDAAACRHVEARWRWKPATRDGQPVAATAAVTVVWNLQIKR
jgi:protein TonB